MASPRDKPDQNASNQDTKSDSNKEECFNNKEEIAGDFAHQGAAGDESSTQTRSESACNTDNPISLTTPAPPANVQHSRIELSNTDKLTKASRSRNPITGMGLNGDGVGGLKPLKPKSRRGEKHQFLYDSIRD